MKIRITENSKKAITLFNEKAAREMVKDFSAKDSGIDEDVKAAARIVIGFNADMIFDVSAEIAWNCRIWNHYSDSSEDLDIWLEFKCLSERKGFYCVGCYLSDIWKSDGDERTTEDIRSHMFIDEYKYIRK